ncbi:MAG: DMT family transporter [Lachnospiraceae bacterium]|nr:DMT family transporter [Lachnospiraceae bacterium]
MASKNTATRAGVAMVVFAAMGWGVIGLFTRYLNSVGLNSIQITFIRSFLSAIGIAIIILVTDKSHFRIKIKDLWMFLVTGICSIALFNVCYFMAIERMALSTASVLLYTSPCMVLIMSRIFFKEKITGNKAVALILAFAGCVMTAGLGSGNNTLTAIGLLLGLIAAFGYSLYTIMGSVALKKYHMLTVTFYTFVFAALALVWFSAPAKIPAVVIADWKNVLYIVLLTLISTLTPFLLYSQGLKVLEPGRASIIAFVEPLTATVMGLIVFHEPLTVFSVIGIALMFGSVILLNIKFKNQQMET